MALITPSSILVLLGLITPSLALVVPLAPARPAEALRGLKLQRVGDSASVDIGAELAGSTGRTLLVLGTHAADFNTVEYLQQARFFWPQLRAKGVGRCLVVINSEAAACARLAELLGLPAEFELLADPTGFAGRRFGVSRGWRPDDASIPAALKLFVVGIGLGPPWGTLPAVLSGYVGSPRGERDWIEASLKQGQLAGRWPAVLELGDDGAVLANQFGNFPLCGGWGLRPLELATLRLQNLLMQAANYDALKPVDSRCLTQLGGCTVVEPGGEPIYSWVDRGLCDVADMRALVDSLPARAAAAAAGSPPAPPVAAAAAA